MLKRALTVRIRLAAPKLLGGTEGCVRLATLFYAEVERDSVLRPLHAQEVPRTDQEACRLASQLAGGSLEHPRSRWWLSLREAWGAGDACPYIPGKRYLDWELPDPKGKRVEEVRETQGRDPSAS